MSLLGSSDASKIIVFSTNAISDPGIDLAGSAHLNYSIVHALERGFNGVFIAACGGDCAYLSDCTTRTSTLVTRAQTLMKEHGISPKRLKMAGLCSVCADNFVSHMNKYQQELKSLEAKSG